MILVDRLLMLPRSNKDDKEIRLDVKICFVQFTTQRLNELKEATRLDPNLNILMKYIYTKDFQISNKIYTVVVKITGRLEMS